MSTGRFAKRDREKARQAKAAAKRARRHGLDDGGSAESIDEAPEPTMDQDAVLAALAALHEAYDAGRLELEDFEQQRAELTAQLRI